jgi:hypothetical protein
MAARTATDFHDERRADRYASRQALHNVSTLRRVRACGRSRISTEAGVTVHVGDDRAHFSNVQLCGSIWACPVCSAKIRNERTEEVRQALGVHVARGGAAVMLTFTVAHHRRHSLGELLGVVRDAWRYLLTGPTWKATREALGVAGVVRSLEITHGVNGWHPHLHVLAFVDQAGVLDELRGTLEARWLGYLRRSGFGALPGIAVQGSAVHDLDGAAEYVGKVQDDDEHALRGFALEVTRHDLKDSRRARQGGATPFGLLRGFRETGDMALVGLWEEYERCTKGKRAITWSVGLRDALGLGQARTDEEIAADEAPGVPLCTIPAPTWAKLGAIRNGPLAVLRGAEVAGVVGVVEVLDAFGLPLVLAVPPLDALATADQSDAPGTGPPAPPTLLDAAPAAP